MSSKNPFELRLELLHLAQAILNERLWPERNRLENDWNAKKERETAKAFYEPYPLVPAPTAQEIIEVAKILNDFVSNNGQ
jgi:hypothetical protein